jgi:histidine ammonia-lyase
LETIARKELDFSQFASIVFDGEDAAISPQQREVVQRSYTFLKEYSKDKIIYGINTGFGPMAQYRISDADLDQLQYNLIRSHSSGLGEGLSDTQVRAVMLCRLNTLCRGGSGISIDVVDQLVGFINQGIYPYIPEHGSVGASGDLVQLAHLALGLIGEGKCRHRGVDRDTADVLRELNIDPLKLKLRDGLGLINGTSNMSGIGLVNLYHAERLLSWAVLMGCTINELVRSFDDSYSQPLNAAKHHVGQQQVAASMRAILADSRLIRKREETFFGDGNINGIDSYAPIKDKVQEYYSFRCIPQILGVVHETLTDVRKVLLDEVNSTNDNPVVDLEGGHVYHGGNFHGDHVSFAMDRLKMVMVRLTQLCERQLNYLCNSAINDKFPPFMNMGTLGLNFGVQGMQFTATSTTAESQTLAYPMYLHTIPCNNDNQDIVSMGSNSALLCYKVIQNAYQVLAIESVAAAQGIDMLGCAGDLSSQSRGLYTAVRSVLPPFADDRPRFTELTRLTAYFMNHPPLHPVL